MTDPFDGLPRNHFKVILADPPWAFQTFSGAAVPTMAVDPYNTMSMGEIKELPVKELADRDCVLFLWFCWPTMPEALEVIKAWGFKYKTCGFSWMKADGRQFDLFKDDITAAHGMGYWTLSNSEVCLLATRGHPKRLDCSVRQGIIERRREHSRKPDCVHERIERLVAGPYLELFARQSRPGWTTWGNEATKFDKPYDKNADFAGSLNEGYAAIRDRVAAGGPGWERK